MVGVDMILSSHEAQKCSSGHTMCTRTRTDDHHTRQGKACHGWGLAQADTLHLRVAR